MRAGTYRLADAQVYDRLAVIRVRSEQHDVRGLLQPGDRVGPGPGQRVVRAGGEAPVMVINVVCAQSYAQQLLEEVRLFGGRMGRADAADRAWAFPLADRT